MPLLSAHWLCSCDRALLCVTAGWVKCHCCLFVGSAGGTLHCYVLQQAGWSVTAVCSLVLLVEPCTAMYYSRLCEVPLFSVHWFCRWNPALLCITAGCVKCHCFLFIGSAGGTLHCYVLQQAVWSATVFCSLVLQVERCTAMYYSRLCEVPLFSVHWLCRWNPALLCITAGCVKCHCFLFIGSAGGTLHCYVLQQAVWSATAFCSLVMQVEPCTAMYYNRLCEVPLLSVRWFCRWNPALLCVTTGWVKCQCFLFIGSAGGTQDVSSLTNQHSVAPFNQTNTAFNKTFCSQTPFFSKNNHRSSHPC